MLITVMKNLKPKVEAAEFVLFGYKFQYIEEIVRINLFVFDRRYCNKQDVVTVA